MNHDQHGTAGALSPEEALALLRYMAEHNRHHAKELRETAAVLPDSSLLLLTTGET